MERSFRGRVLNRVTDWLKYEEAKNGALVALDGVGVGVIAQWLNNASQGLSPWLKALLGLLLISIIIALFSFYPLLKGEKLHINWARRYRPAPTVQTLQTFSTSAAAAN